MEGQRCRCDLQYCQFWISEKNCLIKPWKDTLLVSQTMEMFLCECDVSQVFMTNKPTIIIRSREQTTFKEVVSSVVQAGAGIAVACRRGEMHLASWAGSAWSPAPALVVKLVVSLELGKVYV